MGGQPNGSDMPDGMTVYGEPAYVFVFETIECIYKEIFGVVAERSAKTTKDQTVAVSREKKRKGIKEITDNEKYRFHPFRRTSITCPVTEDKSVRSE